MQLHLVRLDQSRTHIYKRRIFLNIKYKSMRVFFYLKNDIINKVVHWCEALIHLSHACTTHSYLYICNYVIWFRSWPIIHQEVHVVIINWIIRSSFLIWGKFLQTCLLNLPPFVAYIMSFLINNTFIIIGVWKISEVIF